MKKQFVFVKDEHRNLIIEECAKAAEKAWPRAHTYASENAEAYVAQDHAVATVVKAIRALATTRADHGRGE